MTHYLPFPRAQQATGLRHQDGRDHGSIPGRAEGEPEDKSAVRFAPTQAAKKLTPAKVAVCGSHCAGLRSLRLLQSNRQFWPTRVFVASDPVANGMRGSSMKNPLDSLWGTVISGLILTVVLYFVVRSMLG
jgi:hypothetical protein